MKATGLARVLLFVGGLAAAFAWWGFAAQQTLLDPAATREATVGLLSAKPVQDEAVGSLADQLEALVSRNVGHIALTSAQTHKLAHNAAVAALNDPELRRAFGDAIASLQQQLIDGDASRKGLTLDTRAVTAAVRHAVARVDPHVAAQMPATPVRLHFDTSRLPSLHGVDQRAGTFTLLAALVAIAAWFGAVLVHPEPWTATRRIGRRVVVIGALPLVFWVLIPAGLRALHFGAADVMSPLASAYGRRLAPAACVVVGFGAALWALGRAAAFTGRRAPGARGSFPRTPASRSSARARYANSSATDRLERVDVRV